MNALSVPARTAPNRYANVNRLSDRPAGRSRRVYQLARNCRFQRMRLLTRLHDIDCLAGNPELQYTELAKTISPPSSIWQHMDVSMNFDAVPTACPVFFLWKSIRKNRARTCSGASALRHWFSNFQPPTRIGVLGLHREGCANAG